MKNWEKIFATQHHNGLISLKCKEFCNSIRKWQNKIDKRYKGHSPKETINGSYTNLKMFSLTVRGMEMKTTNYCFAPIKMTKIRLKGS